MVTTKPGDLSIQQRLPHYDDSDPARFAMVLYLRADESMGTAFYRHCSTGFEAITPPRKPIYHDQLEAELRLGGVPRPAYADGETSLFEHLFAAPARYNRALLYRSNRLHKRCQYPRAAALPAGSGDRPPDRHRLLPGGIKPQSRPRALSLQGAKVCASSRVSSVIDRSVASFAMAMR